MDKINTMNRQQKIEFGIGSLVLAGALVMPVCQIIPGIRCSAMQKMQERQDAIVRSMNLNPLTRVANAEDFVKIYRAEQDFYDESRAEFSGLNTNDLAYIKKESLRKENEQY